MVGGLAGPEENVATLRHGATVIRGEMKASLLDGDSQNYDLDRGFTRHPIDDNHGQGIVIKLGKPCIINTVRMLLWDRDMRYVRFTCIHEGYLTSHYAFYLYMCGFLLVHLPNEL